MKCDDIFTNIINESVNVNENSRYKVYGFFQIVEDNYNEGEINDIDNGIFDDFFGKTPEDALYNLANAYNFMLNSNDFEFTNINDRSEIQGSFMCNKDGKRIDLENEPELYEKWKIGKINLYSYHYQIIIQKITYTNINKTEQQQIINNFSK